MAIHECNIDKCNELSLKNFLSFDHGISAGNI